MKKILGLFIFSLIFVAFTQMESGIEGTWKASMDTPNGPMEITYNFDVEGDALSGTVVTAMGEVDVKNGSVDGDTFSFDTSFNNMTISHDCELTDENTINMEFTMTGMGMEPQSLTLTRASTE